MSLRFQVLEPCRSAMHFSTKSSRLSGKPLPNAGSSSTARLPSHGGLLLALLITKGLGNQECGGPLCRIKRRKYDTDRDTGSTEKADDHGTDYLNPSSFTADPR